MTQTHDLLQLIKDRRSVRTFDPRPIPQSILNEFKAHLKDLESSNEGRFRLGLIHRDLQLDDKPLKLGTYGVIYGASTYLVGILNKQGSPLELGNAFERAVLKATQLGLGTVWLGGTFNRSDFEKAIPLNDDETIAVVSPVGFAKETASLIDTAFRLGAGSKHRKPWSELFFDLKSNQALTPHDSGAYAQVLESVRLAPSASNKQPWRIFKDGSDYHLMMERTPGYQKVMTYDLQLNDLGIACCHFELSASALGIKGSWIEKDPGLIDPKLVYIRTWHDEDA